MAWASSTARETDETVALKVLKTEIAARPDYIERFKSELRLARKITHKNVCRTHELLRFDDTVAIAMEFVEGGSLRAVLKRFGGVPLRRGIEWLGQMCSALGEAHAQGIVHRDLKPENLLVDREGQIRIMDFGMGRRLTANAPLLTLLGGACWATFELGSVPIDYYNVGVSFVVAAAFALVLLRFDMLTLLAAALSCDLWGHGYTLLQIFDLVGNTPVTLLFVLWGIALAAAIYFGFRPLLQQAGRRAARPALEAQPQQPMP